MTVMSMLWLSCGVVAIGLAAVVVTHWCGRADEMWASRRAGPVSPEVIKEEHDLVVGREYMYKAATGDEWKTCLYMGKQFSGKYLFWNIKNGDEIEVTTRSGTKDKILDDVNFKWLPDHMQSRLDCPPCENIT